jgi:hypothetical protein
MIGKEILIRAGNVALSGSLLVLSIALFNVEDREALLAYTSTIFLYSVLIPPVPLHSRNNIHNQIKYMPINTAIIIGASLILFAFSIINEVSVLSALAACIIYAESLFIAKMHSSRNEKKYFNGSLAIILLKASVLTVLVVAKLQEFKFNIISFYFFYTTGSMIILLPFYILVLRKLLFRGFNDRLATYFHNLPFVKNVNSAIGSMVGSIVTSYGLSVANPGLYDVLYRVGSIINVGLVSLSRIIYFKKNVDRFHELVKYNLISSSILSFVLIMDLMLPLIGMSYANVFPYVVALIAYSILNSMLGLLSLIRTNSQYYMIPALALSYAPVQMSGLFSLMITTLVLVYVSKRLASDHKFHNPNW